jgi:hypothetical protein
MGIVRNVAVVVTANTAGYSAWMNGAAASTASLADKVAAAHTR